MFKAPKPKIEKFGFTQRQSFLYNFNLKPIDLETYLDEYLIGQKEAKGVIATKICTHFHKAKNLLYKEGNFKDLGFIKNNILIIGPTGVGKTFTIKLIAHKIGVPFAKGDATKYSETGYVGGDVEDLIRELYFLSGGDLEKARFGIVYLDEIDKITSSGEVIGPDVSRTGVQRTLLKLLEETEVEIKLPPDNFPIFDVPEERVKKGKLTLNTKYILFVVSGAFQGLEEIIKKRMKKQKLGFLSEIEDREGIAINYLKFVTPEDLVTYGFEREFVGRFPVIVVFDPLSEEDLYEILANPNSSILLNKKRDFKVYGIDIAFSNEALKTLATLAYREGTGARALVRVLENVLIPYERILPSYHFEYLGVTEELIRNPQEYLQALLNSPQNDRWKETYYKALSEERDRVLKYFEKREDSKEKFPFLTPNRLNLIFKLYKWEDVELSQVLEEITSIYKQIKAYESAFSKRNQLQITFSDLAIDYIMEEVLKRDQGVFGFCERHLSSLEYPLSLLKEKTNRRFFYITEKAFLDPDEFLKDLLEQ